MSNLDNAERILNDARDTICGPRQGDYGHPSVNLNLIARLWSDLLPVERPITAREVCKAMIALKLSRDKNKPVEDNIRDILGYAALMSEVSEPIGHVVPDEPSVVSSYNYIGHRWRPGIPSDGWFCTSELGECEEDATWSTVDDTHLGLCDECIPAHWPQGSREILDD